MRSLSLLALYLSMGLPTALFVLPWTWITGDPRLLFRAGFRISRVGLRLAGVRVQASGREHVPAERACIFMANHASNLDPPVLLPFTPPLTAVFLKQSLMRIPVLGLAMRMAGFIAIRRGGSVQAVKETTEAARRALAAGRSLLVFPEGTRSPDGRLLPFRKGLFHLAMETGAPIVPITLSGTAALMPKGSLRVRPGVARVRFHPPVWPREYATREALLQAVREAIAGGLPDGLGSGESRERGRPLAGGRE